MRASVVVPTYNRPDTLERTVKSVLEQSIEEFELIVVDDGSDDEDQLALLDKLADRSRIQVLRQENQGPAAARNNGWRSASTDVVLFTDDDCLVPPDWIEQMLDAYDEYRDIAGVGGPLTPPDDLVESELFARYDWFKNEYVYELPDEPQRGGAEVHVGGTANMSYRRDVLEAVGGFDESFPVAAGEDADLKARVVEAGYELLYLPVAVEHRKQYTLEAFISQSIRRGRGEYFFWKKHGRNRSTFRILAGLVGAPIGTAPELTIAQPGVSVLHILHRVLSRYGELKEKFKANS